MVPRDGVEPPTPAFSVIPRSTKGLPGGLRNAYCSFIVPTQESVGFLKIQFADGLATPLMPAESQPRDSLIREAQIASVAELDNPISRCSTHSFQKSLWPNSLSGESRPSASSEKNVTSGCRKSSITLAPSSSAVSRSADFLLTIYSFRDETESSSFNCSAIPSWGCHAVRKG